MGRLLRTGQLMLRYEAVAPESAIIVDRCQ
jgi:hypothetical protein